jgi:hypothetical protein
MSPGSDKVVERLNEIGEVEMKRMNQAERLGEVQVEEDGLQVNYYKLVKEYVSYYPVEASATSRASDRDRGFCGVHRVPLPDASGPPQGHPHRGPGGVRHDSERR